MSSPPKKRSMRVRQVGLNFFEEVCEGARPPVSLIQKMGASELYEDVYATKDMKSATTKQEHEYVVKAVGDIQNEIRAHVVTAHDGNDGHVLHTHLPYSELFDSAKKLDLVKNARSLPLLLYTRVEAYFLQQGFRVPKGGSLNMSVKDFVHDLRAVALHGIFATQGLLVFCMDDMDHYFLGVRVSGMGVGEGQDYTCRADMSDADQEKQVVVRSYFYFTCPCDD
jgi:hypothetical protein